MCLHVCPQNKSDFSKARAPGVVEAGEQAVVGEEMTTLSRSPKGRRPEPQVAGKNLEEASALGHSRSALPALLLGADLGRDGSPDS